MAMAMNRRQKEVAQAALSDEQHALQLLKRIYQKARQDTADRIAQLNSRTDMQNLQSIIYQKKYQQILQKQLDGVLKDLDQQKYDTVTDYLKRSYEHGFYGTLYDMQGQGVPLLFPMRQDEVVKALNNDYSNIAKTANGKRIYTLLGVDTDKLRKQARAEISRGVANGSSWLDMAQKVASGMGGPFQKSLSRATLITRTEGHRVQNQATLDVQHHAKDLGADVVKQWDATLDEKTRPWHADADGQIREIDQDFDVNGEKMKAPGIGGSASNVCNCRCVCLQRARWALTGEQTKYLGDVSKMTDKQKEDIAGKLGVSVDDLPNLSKSIVKIHAKDYDDFRQQAEHAPIDIDGFPEQFKSKKEMKNTQQLIDYINENCKDGNPEVIEIYSHCGSVVQKGTEIKHTSKSEFASWGSISKHIDYPKITETGKAGQVQTTLHEMGHMIDFNAAGVSSEYITDRADGLHQVFMKFGNWGLPKEQVGSDSLQVFKELRDDMDAVMKDVRSEYDPQFKQLDDWFKSVESDDAHAMENWKTYDSKWKALKRKADKAYKERSRSVAAGRDCFEDIYDALSKGNFASDRVVNYGHGVSYYNRYTACEKETIANYMSLSVTRPDLIEVLRKDQPDLCDACDKTIKEIYSKVVKK